MNPEGESQRNIQHSCLFVSCVSVCVWWHWCRRSTKPRPKWWNSGRHCWCNFYQSDGVPFIYVCQSRVILSNWVGLVYRRLLLSNTVALVVRVCVGTRHLWQRLTPCQHRHCTPFLDGNCVSDANRLNSIAVRVPVHQRRLDTDVRRTRVLTHSYRFLNEFNSSISVNRVLTRVKWIIQRRINICRSTTNRWEDKKWNNNLNCASHSMKRWLLFISTERKKNAKHKRVCWHWTLLCMSIVHWWPLVHSASPRVRLFEKENSFDFFRNARRAFMV